MTFSALIWISQLLSVTAVNKQSIYWWNYMADPLPVAFKDLLSFLNVILDFLPRSPVTSSNAVFFLVLVLHIDLWVYIKANCGPLVPQSDT